MECVLELRRDDVEMLSQLGCADEDNDVDPQLGYPPAYPKLCRHAHASGLPMPYTEGPPQRFLPYCPETEDVSAISAIFLSVITLSFFENGQK